MTKVKRNKLYQNNRIIYLIGLLLLSLLVHICLIQPSTYSLTATPPLPLIVSKYEYDSSSHIDLLEQNDGVKHHSNVRTWEAEAMHFSKKNEEAGMIEFDEWMLSNAFVREGDVVIEFGARYGTTSCILSRNTGKTGHVIAVEPDIKVHGYLLRNLHTHRCSAYTVLGTVSNKPLYMQDANIDVGYATSTTAKPQEGGGVALPSIDVATIEKTVGKRINIALIDCEGCIPFVKETGLLDAENGVDIILIEEDAIDYKPWHKSFFQEGYKCLWYLKDTTTPRQRWSIDMRHSAWIHKRILNDSKRKYLSCQDYVISKGYNSSQIDCAKCPVSETV